MAENELKFVEKLIYSLCDMPVRVFNDEPEEEERFFRELAHNGILGEDSAEYYLRRIRSIKTGCVYEVTTIFDTRIAMAAKTESVLLVVGPCLTEEFSTKKLEEILRRRRLGQSFASRLRSYCSGLPQIRYDVFHRLSTMLAARYLDICEPVPYERINQVEDVEIERQLVLQENFDELSKMRHIERRYEYSNAMTEAVKAGNLTLAYSFLRQMRPGSNEIVRSPNPLRNSQNLCIIANTQLRHAMEENGIHPYVLDKLSGEIAVKIEKLRTQQEAENFSLEIIRRYTELAQQQSVAELKPLSRLAVTYIKAHLSDNLSVKSTAKALVVNPNYLSTQFHKELGMTFTEYVNRERTRQAAALLLHTKLPIQHIAGSVGYNNTSYFAKQFTIAYGVSPRSYRNRSARPDSGKALQR